MLQQMTCPRCQSPISVDIHQLIDAQRTPALKQLLLNGQLNIFQCANCGLAGQVSSPLLYHDADHEMLLVHVPMDMNLPHMEQERLIGRMLQEILDMTPVEQRRGYMLQPQTIISQQSFVEKVLETEGVTPEMLARQREQVQLLETLISAAPDVVEILLVERSDEIDETFFAMLQTLLQAAEQAQDGARMVQLTNLQVTLYTETETGRQIERRQIALRRFQQEARQANELTPTMLLKHILENRDDETTVQALASVGQSALDYTFFVALTEEIETLARQKKKPEVRQLTRIRQMLLAYQKAMDEATKQMVERANVTLHLLLEAEDTRAAIQEHRSALDESFIYLLNATIVEAERQGRTTESERMRQIHTMIMEEAEDQMPPEVHLVNDLLSAESDSEQRRLLDENSQLVTPDLAEMLTAVEHELGSDSPVEIRDRLSRVQAMVALRVA